jgi:BMFP domain-containing protein YqiC
MIKPQILQQLADEIAAKLSSGSQTASGNTALKSLVQEAVSRLDLVTRQDYERLLEIHQRTRQRVDELNHRMIELENSSKSGA